MFSLFLFGCTDYQAQNKQLTEENKQLKIENEQLREENNELIEEIQGTKENKKKLSLRLADYGRENAMQKKEIEALELSDNEVIIPKGLNLEVFKVLLTYFKGVNENDEDKIRSVVKTGEWNEERLLNWGKSSQVNLVRVHTFGEDDIGRPRYVMNIYFYFNGKLSLKTFIMHKFKTGWRLVDID